MICRLPEWIDWHDYPSFLANQGLGVFWVHRQISSTGVYKNRNCTGLDHNVCCSRIGEVRKEYLVPGPDSRHGKRKEQRRGGRRRRNAMVNPDQFEILKGRSTSSTSNLSELRVAMS